MKKIILLMAMGLAACNESGGSASLSAPCEPVPPSHGTFELQQIRDTGHEGYLVDSDAEFDWFKAACEPYYFGLKKSDGSVRTSSGLIYSDSQCLNVTHEVFDYPLHFSGDIYVFMFESQLYQYPLGYSLDTLTDYYYKTPGGVCEHRTTTITTARVVESFSGVSLY
jgi:hypothetical protein